MFDRKVNRGAVSSTTKLDPKDKISESQNRLLGECVAAPRDISNGDAPGENHLHSVMQNHYHSKGKAAETNRNSGLRSILNMENKVASTGIVHSTNNYSVSKSNHTLASLSRPETVSQKNTQSYCTIGRR